MKACILFSLLSIAVVMVIPASGQEVAPSVLNILRYGNGRSGNGDFLSNVEYIENLTDVRIRFPYSVITGFRLLYDQPPEVGPRFKGIRRRWVEVEKEGVTLRAGNSSELYGRGLALNLFEDRGLAFDTWLDGVKAIYETSILRASVLAGSIEFWDSIVVARTENYNIRASNIEVKPLEWIMVGASYLTADGIIPQPEVGQPIHAEIVEAYVSVRTGGFDAFLGWAHKWTNVEHDQTSAGTGIYSSMSFAGTDFGISIDYKNYQYDVRDPFSRYDAIRATRMLPFQNPPIVQREHSSTFLTRPIHQVDFNDEVGIQMDLFFSPMNGTTVTMNVSLSSDHNEFLLQQQSFNFVLVKRPSSFLPTTSHALSPYHEIFIEAEHTFSNGIVGRLGLAQRQLVQAVRFSGSVNDHITTSTVVPLNILHFLGEVASLQLQIEQEWVHDNYNTGKSRFSNTLFGATIARSPDVTITGRVEVTSNSLDVSGRRAWFAGEFGYRIAGSHSIVLTFGQERGGQVCMNGVCRYVQPFSGIRFFVQSII